MGWKRLVGKTKGLDQGGPSGTKPDTISPKNPSPPPPDNAPHSYPKPGHRDNPYRVLSSPDRDTLSGLWGEEDLQESLMNDSNQVWGLLEGIITDRGAEFDYYEYILDEDRPGAKLRWCSACNDQGVKEDMIKCRGCWLWFHGLCDAGIDRIGESPTKFRFWKCSDCEPDSPGDCKDIHSLSDIERDDHFEDTDTEDDV